MAVEPQPASTLEAILASVRAQLITERASRERAVLALTETLAIVSDELRNPLNVIGIAVHELLDAELDEVTRAHNKRAIVRAVSRAERLIRDLLDAHRIDSGGLVVELRSVTVASLLERVASEHAEAAAGAGTPIALRIDPGVDRVHADPERIVQALGHLVGNAIRHARGTGAITLWAAREGERIALTVDDQGPGVSPAVLPHIFDRFWPAHRQRCGGAGLGLAIAQGIVVGHGGAMTVDRAPGAGARFRFTLARA